MNMKKRITFVEKMLSDKDPFEMITEKTGSSTTGRQNHAAKRI